MASHRSFAAYTAYKEMYEEMKITVIDGQNKTKFSYEIREDVDTKFAPANSNKEEIYL